MVHRLFLRLSVPNQVYFRKPQNKDSISVIIIIGISSNIDRVRGEFQNSKSLNMNLVFDGKSIRKGKYKVKEKSGQENKTVREPSNETMTQQDCTSQVDCCC
jgi:hypothetical protein